MRYADVWPKYAGYWNEMVINPSRVAEFTTEAEVAIKNKLTYQQISSATKSRVPWPMIAVIHRRESNASFNTYLGNGQSLTRRTTIVPKGRGPFTNHLPDMNAFVMGGIDAIQIEGWDDVFDWRLEKQLYYCMLFNGAGYEMRGIPSPYVWGGTNVQKPGKYVADGVFNATVMDTQPGCAPMLQMISKLDSSVIFTRET